MTRKIWSYTACLKIDLLKLQHLKITIQWNVSEPTPRFVCKFIPFPVTNDFTIIYRLINEIIVQVGTNDVRNNETRASFICLLDDRGPSLVSSFRNNHRQPLLYSRGGFEMGPAHVTFEHTPRERPHAREIREHRTCAPCGECDPHRGHKCHVNWLRLSRTAESNRLLTRFRELTSPLCYLNESRVHLAPDVNYFPMWWAIYRLDDVTTVT